jgi:starvation-inducible outer membrane lipoprotein
MNKYFLIGVIAIMLAGCNAFPTDFMTNLVSPNEVAEEIPPAPDKPISE